MNQEAGEFKNIIHDILFSIDSISIMIDPDLHPLPITPNDPLSIFAKMDYQKPKDEIIELPK